MCGENFLTHFNGNCFEINTIDNYTGGHSYVWVIIIIVSLNFFSKFEGTQFGCVVQFFKFYS